MGVLMAVTLAATMLGLVYLTQTVGSNATSSQIRELRDQRTKLGRILDRQAVGVELRTEADAIIEGAKKQNLQQLGGLVVLRAP